MHFVSLNCMDNFHHNFSRVYKDLLKIFQFNISYNSGFHNVIEFKISVQYLSFLR